MKKSGAEIDFILDKTKAYEIKLRPVRADLEKLQSLARGLGLKKSHLVSLAFTHLPDTIYGFEL